jgi:DNA invertase Pin-like site-specific DNA recombinase
MALKSERRDGRGHWPKGKRRSPMEDKARRKLIRDIRLLIDHGVSRKAISRAFRRSDRTIARWLSGAHFPMKDPR